MQGRFPAHRLFASLLVCGILLAGSAAKSQGLSLTNLFYAFTPADSNALTHNIELQWSARAANVTIDGLKRDTGPNTTATVLTTAISDTNRVYYDTSWVSGVSYRYYLYGTASVEKLDPWGNHYNPPQYQSVGWQSNYVNVKPYDLTVRDNATADSRIDPRYSAVTYVNFPFNNSNVTTNPTWLH